MVTASAEQNKKPEPKGKGGIGIKEKAAYSAAGLQGRVSFFEERQWAISGCTLHVYAYRPFIAMRFYISRLA